MSEVEANAGGGGKEQDRFLSVANIGRIMRRAVPENGKIARDARESIQECVSEFINSSVSSSSQRNVIFPNVKERRKTINDDDIIWSLGTLGFEEYVEPLKIYLNNYRETEGDTKGSKSSDQNGKKQMLPNGELGSPIIFTFWLQNYHQITLYLICYFTSPLSKMYGAFFMHLLFQLGQCFMS
ncbi:nuclear transcription factor Y subunit B-4-like [Zea mays]|uniref:nuclear transcription factor Y subunit B-4-like n=1 Tax=Zea mays TaxID=4577 RepID=UPI0009A9910B|nr:nuclear transcription factor Y subunit B-4-like [Zea mays]|eukprot:XP_020400198.1 nuclear transcription factor Y subunit B-4-like [Zea mays]